MCAKVHPEACSGFHDGGGGGGGGHISPPSAGGRVCVSVGGRGPLGTDAGSGRTVCLSLIGPPRPPGSTIALLCLSPPSPPSRHMTGAAQ